jgi:hypothetical protein
MNVSDLFMESDAATGFHQRTGVKGEHDAEWKLAWYFSFDEMVDDPRWGRLRIFVS